MPSPSRARAATAQFVGYEQATRSSHGLRSVDPEQASAIIEITHVTLHQLTRARAEQQTRERQDRVLVDAEAMEFARNVRSSYSAVTHPTIAARSKICRPLDGIGVDYALERDGKRGLAYYVDDGFEAKCAKLAAQKQIAGGGRYAEGIGWAIGLDRLLRALDHVTEPDGDDGS